MDALGSNAGLLVATKWASERYREASRKYRFRHLRRVGEVIIPAEVNGGTVSATRGSDVITGDATAVAAWTSDLVGRIIRISRNWYRISGVDTGASTLKLESEFAEGDVTAHAYRIVVDRVQLDKDARFFGPFVHPRFARVVTQTSLANLDEMEPDRLIVSGSGPELVAEVGSGDDGSKVVEFYPYSTNTELVRYIYWIDPQPLAVGGTIPDAISPEALKDGILVDIMRQNSARAAKAGNIEAAAYWRNEYRAQETLWRRRMQEMVAADRGAEDLAVILHTRGLPVQDSDDPVIRTGRTDAWTRFTEFPRVL